MGGVFLGTGVTRGLSQVDGGAPLLTTVLMIWVRTGASSIAQCFQYETSSIPGDVLFRVDNA